MIETLLLERNLDRPEAPVGVGAGKVEAVGYHVCGSGDVERGRVQDVVLLEAELFEGEFAGAKPPGRVRTG